MKPISIEVLDAVDTKVLNKDCYDLIWKILCYPVEVRTISGKMIFYKSFIDRRSGKFPTGLVPVVKRRLEKEGYILLIKKVKFKKLELEQDISNLTVTLEDYQKDVLTKIERTNRGLILCPTAGGKTLLEAAIINTYNLPKTLIIVPNRDVFYQTKEFMKRYLSLSDKHIGLLGDNNRKIGLITIGLYQTLVKYDLKELNKQFSLVLVDEVHGSKAESYQIIMNQLKDIHYRYGFTGTLRTRQPDNYTIQGIFGPPLAIVTEKAAYKRVTDVNLYMLQFHDQMTFCIKYQDRVRTNIWLNENRNEFIADIVDYIVSRNKTILILTEKYEHAKSIQKEVMRKKILTPVIWHKVPNEEREEYKRQLNNKELFCVIATPAISVGSNIPNLECVLIASETYDWLNLVQKIGRGRRRTSTKDILYAIDIYNTFSGKDWNFKKQSDKKAKVYRKKGWLKGIITLDEFKEIIK